MFSHTQNDRIGLMISHDTAQIIEFTVKAASIVSSELEHYLEVRCYKSLFMLNPAEQEIPGEMKTMVDTALMVFDDLQC